MAINTGKKVLIYLIQKYPRKNWFSIFHMLPVVWQHHLTWIMLLGVCFSNSDNIKHHHLLSFISAVALEKQLSWYRTSLTELGRLPAAADVTCFVVIVEDFWYAGKNMICGNKRKEKYIFADVYLLSNIVWSVYWLLSYLNY